MDKVKLIECPRDAMQGWESIIPTEEKIAYLNQLLKVGFNTIDFGSFVSAKAIPQMADTKAVLEAIDLKNTSSELLAIIANQRGAEEASGFKEILFLGYPFSISETFQFRNTNKSIGDSFHLVKEILTIARSSGKEAVIYISMAFGNPYGDTYSEKIVFNWVDQLINAGVKIISLADTVGLANHRQVYSICNYLNKVFPEIEIGAHLHAGPNNWKDKLAAAYDGGCNRIDSALLGYGGCPMAEDDLVGNIATENVISFFNERKIDLDLNMEELKKAEALARKIFIKS